MIAELDINLETIHGPATFTVRQMDGDRCNYVWLELVQSCGPALAAVIHQFISVLPDSLSKTIVNIIDSKKDVDPDIAKQLVEPPVEDEPNKPFDMNAWKTITGCLTPKLYDFLKKEVLYSVKVVYHDEAIQGNVQAQKILGSIFPGSLSSGIFELIAFGLSINFSYKVVPFIGLLKSGAQELVKMMPTVLTQYFQDSQVTPMVGSKG
jgi:hypothetical protein